MLILLLQNSYYLLKYSTNIFLNFDLSNLINGVYFNIFILSSSHIGSYSSFLSSILKVSVIVNIIHRVSRDISLDRYNLTILGY